MKQLFSFWIKVGLLCAFPILGVILITHSHHSAPEGKNLSIASQSPLNMCAAVRGNGELILAHFASYAKLTEQVGMFDGMAGGSSASVSMFIYESIMLNPAAPECSDCTNSNSKQLRLRYSFLIKSIWEYLNVLGNTDEAKAIFGLVEILSKSQIKSIEDLLNSKNMADTLKAKAAIISILQNPDISSLVNPELFVLLKMGPKGVNEAFDILKNFGNFKAEDPRIFFRPGPLSFSALAKKIGRIANFYAGRGNFFDKTKLSNILDDCAGKAEGLRWSELSQKYPECSQKMNQFITEYRQNLLKNEDAVPSRLKDPVGEKAHILVSNSVLMGSAVAKFKEGFEKYKTGNFEGFQFKVFDQIGFGIWGSPNDLNFLNHNKNEQRDLKTAKRFLLGSPSWETAITYSPAEPGLSAIHVIDREIASSGGWPDLAPTLVLHDLGCKNIIYITRRGEESVFAQGVATNLGMTEEQKNALYNLKNPNSSFSLSLKAATASYCTDWNSFNGKQTEEINVDAYNNSVLVTPSTSPKIVGCSP